MILAAPPTFSPHARGWPEVAGGVRDAIGSSPRTRGDGPSAIRGQRGQRLVLPARAGMARIRGSLSAWWWQFSPHARGWPGAPDCRPPASSCFPRTRGDGPWVRSRNQPPASVLPARAGMARGSARSNGGFWFRPRTRGDGPPHGTT